MKRDPADMLAEHLIKQIKGWSIEWRLDKYTIIGILEDIKQEFVWSDTPENAVIDEDYLLSQCSSATKMTTKKRTTRTTSSNHVRSLP